ncbi:MAG: hypothetical protein M5U31_00355 [Acidimicrobiia bacterium]|nr:hypothetical protein [Acidimicrobiia bacterium]
MAPHPERVLKLVRQAGASSEDPIDQVEAIVEVAREQAMQPAPPREPLPEVTEDDLHVICCLRSSERRE